MNCCVVCGSTDCTVLYPQILECRKCGHVFADLNLEKKEIHSLYNEDYFFGNEYKDYVSEKEALQINFRCRVEELSAFIDKSKHTNLLEIGCAYGFFLDIVRDSFSSVFGVDVSREGVVYAKEHLSLNALEIDFLDFDLKDEVYDVVCMWDVVEHLLRPDLYFEKISDHMKPGGIVALTTGDIKSVNAKFRGSKWRMIHPPTHIHYFHKNSMQAILKKYGFSIVYNKHCGNYRTFDNTLYNILVLRNGMEKTYKFLKRFVGDKGFSINLYDIMSVVAVKD